MYRSSIFKVALFIMISLVVAGCKSYTIPFDPSLAGKKTTTGLYVPDLPPVYINFEGLIKYPIHGSAVEKAFMEANLKEIIFEEFKRHGQDLSSKVSVVINESVDKSIQLTPVENAGKLEPKDCEFVFTDIPKQIGKDYLMIIKIHQYGFNEGGFNNYATLTYIASINDMKNNRKVWQLKGKKSASFPLLQIGYAPAKNPEKVRDNLRDCVNGMLRDIMKDLK